MRKLGLVVSLVLSGCGSSSDGLPSQLGAAPDLVGAVSYAQADTKHVMAQFWSHTSGFGGIPLVWDCASSAVLNSRPGATLPGPADRDLGAEVVLQSGSAVITASPSSLDGKFMYLSQADSGFVPDASYDLVAADAQPPFTVIGALRTAAELTVSEPPSRASVSRGPPMEVCWTGSGGDFVTIAVDQATQVPSGFGCLVADAGCFTVPGTFTSTLYSGVQTTLTVTRHVVTTTKVAGLGSVLGTSAHAAYVPISPGS